MDDEYRIGKEDLIFAARYLAQKAQRLVEACGNLPVNPQTIDLNALGRVKHDCAMLTGAISVTLDVAEQLEEDL